MLTGTTTSKLRIDKSTALQRDAMQEPRLGKQNQTHLPLGVSQALEFCVPLATIFRKPQLFSESRYLEKRVAWKQVIVNTYRYADN